MGCRLLSASIRPAGRNQRGLLRPAGPLPAVAPESSRWPRRRLTVPSTGMMITLDAVSTMPSADAAAG